MNVPLQANPNSLSLVDKVNWSTEWIQRMKGQIFALQNGGTVAGVSSVFGRTGNVVAQSGDYPFSFLSSIPTTIAGYGITDPIVYTSGSYADPAWITSLNWSKVTSTPTTLGGYGITDAIPLSQKAANSGVASLDVTGKVPLAQLPTLPSQYKGTWNAFTNTPTLLNTSGGTAGDFYIVSTSGTTNFGAGGITFNVNDEVVFGTVWQRIPTAGNQLASDWNATSGVTAISNKPTTFTALGVQIATSRLLGRTTAGTGVPEAITVTAPLVLSGLNLSISGSTTTIDTLGGATLNTIDASGGSFTFNGNNGTIQKTTISHSPTTPFTIINLKIGIPYTLLVQQDLTGSRTLTWSTTVKVAYNQLGAPPISTVGGAIDKYVLTYDGTIIYVDYGLSYN